MWRTTVMYIPSQHFAQWGPHGPHGPHGPMGPDWVARSGLAPWSNAGATGFELLLPLIWALLLGVVLVGMSYLLLSRAQPARSDRATTLLRERYARGELSDEEFEHRAERLGDRSDGRASS